MYENNNNIDQVVRIQQHTSAALFLSILFPLNVARARVSAKEAMDIDEQWEC